MSTIRVKEIKSTNSDPISIEGGISADYYFGDGSNLTKTISTIVPVGEGAMTVNSHLNYGINIIEESDISNYCVRLPETPIAGREVQIINNSKLPITVYPSKENGTINNLFPGELEIPNDGNLYSFSCLKSSGGGQWTTSLSPIGSLNRYDSGEITAFMTGSTNNSISASDLNRWVETTLPTVSYSWGYTWGVNGLNQPQYLVYNTATSNNPPNYVAWRPSRPWAYISKVTIYTNMAFYNGQIFTIYYQGVDNYYSTTNQFLGWLAVTPTNLIVSQATSSLITGSTGTTITGFTSNAGDVGTYYGELIYPVSAARPQNIGNVLYGIVPNPFGSGNAVKVRSTYINCLFKPNIVSQEFKYRFIIDYVTFSYPPPAASPL